MQIINSDLKMTEILNNLTDLFKRKFDGGQAIPRLVKSMH